MAKIKIEQKNNHNQKQTDKAETMPQDKARRSILKGAGALGVLYLAPTTLNLLMPDKSHSAALSG